GVRSRSEPAGRQVEPTSSAPRQSSTHHTTPVTNSTAVTVYSEARTRGSSRTMLDLRPIAGDVHAAVARDEERARAVVIEETDHHLSRHDDDLGEGVRHQARRRAHGGAGDPVHGAPAPRIDDGEPADLRAHRRIESARGPGKG